MSTIFFLILKHVTDDDAPNLFLLYTEANGSSDQRSIKNEFDFYLLFSCQIYPPNSIIEIMTRE